MYSENGFLARDYDYAVRYGEKKLFEELDEYSKVIGRDWLEAYSERLPDGTLEEFHKEALRKMKL